MRSSWRSRSPERSLADAVKTLTLARSSASPPLWPRRLRFVMLAGMLAAFEAGAVGEVTDLDVVANLELPRPNDCLHVQILTSCSDVGGSRGVPRGVWGAELAEPPTRRRATKSCA